MGTVVPTLDKYVINDVHDDDDVTNLHNELLTGELDGVVRGNFNVIYTFLAKEIG